MFLSKDDQFKASVFRKSAGAVKNLFYIKEQLKVFCPQKIFEELLKFKKGSVYQKINLDLLYTDNPVNSKSVEDLQSIHIFRRSVEGFNSKNNFSGPFKLMLSEEAGL